MPVCPQLRDTVLADTGWRLLCLQDLKWEHVSWIVLWGGWNFGCYLRVVTRSDYEEIVGSDFTGQRQQDLLLLCEWRPASSWPRGWNALFAGIDIFWNLARFAHDGISRDCEPFGTGVWGGHQKPLNSVCFSRRSCSVRLSAIHAMVDQWMRIGNEWLWRLVVTVIDQAEDPSVGGRPCGGCYCGKERCPNPARDASPPVPHQCDPEQHSANHNGGWCWGYACGVWVVSHQSETLVLWNFNDTETAFMSSRCHGRGDDGW